MSNTSTTANAFLGSDHDFEWYLPVDVRVKYHHRTLKKHVKVESRDELSGEIRHSNRFSCTSLFEKIERDINLLELRGVERKMKEQIEKWIAEYIERAPAGVDELYPWSLTAVCLTSSSMLEVVAELPILALILQQDATPMHIGSRLV